MSTTLYITTKGKILFGISFLTIAVGVFVCGFFLSRLLSDSSAAAATSQPDPSEDKDYVRPLPTQLQTRNPEWGVKDYYAFLRELRTKGVISESASKLLMRNAMTDQQYVWFSEAKQSGWCMEGLNTLKTEDQVADYLKFLASGKWYKE
jgi:hypothetical protein